MVLEARMQAKIQETLDRILRLLEALHRCVSFKDLSPETQGDVMALLPEASLGPATPAAVMAAALMKLFRRKLAELGRVAERAVVAELAPARRAAVVAANDAVKRQAEEKQKTARLACRKIRDAKWARLRAKQARYLRIICEMRERIGQDGKPTL